MTRTPMVAVISNPLQIDIGPTDFRPVREGATLAEMAPSVAHGYVCWLRGDDLPEGAWISREQWHQQPRAGDVIVFHRAALGGGGQGSNPLRTLLQLAVLVAATTLFPGSTFLQIAGRVATIVVGNLLINALVPLDQSNAASELAGSPNYSVALQGNQARLEQPIPDLYGHNNTYPDFAAQPYSVFEDGDQYYHACLLVGQGQYQILRVSIDDTPVQQFQDVEVLYVGPGQAVTTLAGQTLVATNVVSAPEVAGQDMKSLQVIGPFAATGPERRSVSIGIDIVLPRGLDDGRSVSWQVQAREINDFEQPQGAWVTLGEESYSTASATPVRLSYDYPVPAARYQVRVQRTDPRDGSATAAHDVSWAGMRATLSEPGIDCTTATYVCLRIRASEQLSGLSQRRVRVLSNRMLPTNAGEGWVMEVTRNPAWALANILRNPVTGRGLPDSQIDLDTLFALAAEYDARQDHFDYAFDTKSTIWDALQLVARVGRAVPLIRGGRYTFVRDSQQTTPVCAFTMRNTRRGSFALSFALPQRDQVTALDVEYYDLRRWDWVVVTAQYHAGTIHVYRGESNRPAGVPAPENRARIRLPGVIGEMHARREAAYRLADTVYRRQRVSLSAELDGNLPAYGSLVTVQHDIPRWGQCGDVVQWSAGTLTVTTSEPLQWTAGATHYMRLQRPDGSLTPEIAVTPGTSPYSAVLASAPGFTPVTDDAALERPRYVFGSASAVGALCRTTAVQPRSERQIDLQLVLEDNRVHTADNAWLPGPGEVQDPISDGSVVVDGGGGGAGTLVNLTYQDIVDLSIGDALAAYALRNDGVAEKTRLAFGTEGIANQWLTTAPVTLDVAALYECRATLLLGDAPTGSPLGTWLSLDTTRSWTVSNTTGGTRFARLRVEIRDIASQVLQGSAIVLLEASSTGGGA